MECANKNLGNCSNELTYYVVEFDKTKYTLCSSCLRYQTYIRFKDHKEKISILSKIQK